MPAAIHDFTIEQGTTLVKTFVWKSSTGVPRNLTGFSARLHIREFYEDAEPLVAMSSADGSIEITPLTGTITLNFSPEMTSGEYWRRGKYDLELVNSDGSVTRLVKGKIRLSWEVTYDQPNA